MKNKSHLEKHFKSDYLTNGNKSIVRNKKGNVAGSVIKNEDGRNTIIVGENPDYISGLMSIFTIFSEDISSEQKEKFSNWADLPRNIWSTKHKEYFAHSMLFYFKELKQSDMINKITPQIANVIKLLPSDYKPTTNKPLSNDVIKIFDSLFEI